MRVEASASTRSPLTRESAICYELTLHCDGQAGSGVTSTRVGRLHEADQPRNKLRRHPQHGPAKAEVQGKKSGMVNGGLCLARFTSMGLSPRSGRAAELTPSATLRMSAFGANDLPRGITAGSSAQAKWPGKPQRARALGTNVGRFPRLCGRNTRWDYEAKRGSASHQGLAS